MNATPTFSTDDAFETLVSDPYRWRRTELPDSRRRWYLHRITHGLAVSTDKKIELLELARFKMLVHPQWIETHR